MNNEQAKARLAAYRPGGQDAGDPELAEALQQATRDPSLRAWLQEQQSFDERMTRALARVPAPASGRETVKATVPPPRARRIAPWQWALAAGLALLLAVGVTSSNRSRVKFPLQASLPEIAVRLVEAPLSLGLVTSDYASLDAWLAAREAPRPDVLPAQLTSLMPLGCQSWETSRGRVSLVCFLLDDRQKAHLLVFTDVAADASFPAPGTVGETRLGDWTALSWRDQEAFFVFLAPGDEAGAEVLRRFPRTRT